MGGVRVSRAESGQSIGEIAGLEAELASLPKHLAQGPRRMRAVANLRRVNVASPLRSLLAIFSTASFIETNARRVPII
jgi:hypothetical protein